MALRSASVTPGLHRALKRKGVITFIVKVIAFIVKVITPGMRWCLNINVLHVEASNTVWLQRFPQSRAHLGQSADTVLDPSLSLAATTGRR